MTLTIVKPGMLSTVQDLGRRGRAALGIPPCGAMDELALRVANRLVGNADERAAIEITLGGPEIRFDEETLVAIAGSRFECEIDGRAMPHGETIAVAAGATLAIGRSLEGARAIVAVAGGIDVAPVLGSRSTFLRGGFGGVDGRALKAGDRLRLGASGRRKRRRLRRDALPRYEPRAALRVVEGPQSDAFTTSGRRTFLVSRYRVSPRSDRMGLRLDGPAIELAANADLLPEGIAPGAIQVPGDGQPIVLGVDRPTTGGYTKIATVVTADLWKTAQAKPGDEVGFVAIDVATARALYREYEEMLRSAVEDAE